MVDPAAAAPMETDPAAAPDAAAPASQGFVIEISCLPDGTFNVSSEPLEAEAAEENAEGTAPAGKPAKSFGEALKLALALYQNDGEDADAQLAGGYDDASAAPPDSVPMTPGTDLATKN